VPLGRPCSFAPGWVRCRPSPDPGDQLAFSARFAARSLSKRELINSHAMGAADPPGHRLRSAAAVPLPARLGAAAVRPFLDQLASGARFATESLSKRELINSHAMAPLTHPATALRSAAAVPLPARLGAAAVRPSLINSRPVLDLPLNRSANAS
jgi:hypothetical protein